MLICNVCGSNKFKEEGDYEVCAYCGAREEKHSLEKTSKALKSLLDETKIEKLSNLKQRLYEKIQEENIDSEAIQEISTDILNIVPNDVFSKFFYKANERKINLKEVAKLIREVEREHNEKFAELVLEFIIKSPALYGERTSTAISSLLNSSFEKSSEKWQELNKKIEKLAKDIDKGVYDVSLPRDAFIAYSSADIEKAVELVENLEENGIKCFISVRNLQHGSGAILNYETDLQTAMDSCKYFIFVSSSNSRSRSCDAYNVELKYIRSLERKTNKKKPKVEYVVEDYAEESNVVDEQITEFFEGLERVYTPKNVAIRIESDDNIDDDEYLKQELAKEKEEKEKLKQEKEKNANELAKEKEDKAKLQQEYEEKIAQLKKQIENNNQSNAVENAEKVRVSDEVVKQTPTKSMVEERHIHNYVSEVVPASCASKGYTLHKCACGDEYKDNYTPIVGHAFGDWTIKKRATCTENGIETRQCKNCGKIEERQISAKGHNFTDWQIDKDGINESRYCKDCGLDETRKIVKESNIKVGDIITLGTYPQGANGEIKPIEWQVLNIENNKALLISKYGLDCKRFNARYESVTWETCDLRKWLNKEFYNKAFSEEDKGRIALSNVTADKNPDYNTNQGNNTKDNVFLLSIKEVKQYFSKDSKRATKGTDYCYKQGAYKCSNGNCWWWLRSSGSSSDYASGVDDGGNVDTSGNYVRSGTSAVRPALKINL